MSHRWPRVIAHVDMDAFFASVEQLIHPEWRGKPVIVGADPRGGKGRGVVSAASYEARKFGIHSAMPISRAYRLCPHGIYVQPHGKLYQHYSRQVFEVLREFTPVIEPISIDEAFLELTGSVHLFGSVENLGQAIKQRIRQRTGLTASVGIAPGKSVAKIASDYDKPDGLTIVPPEEVQAFLDPLPVSALWGVGKQMVEALHRMGVKTVADLRHLPPELLKERFGKIGQHIYRMACGQDERPVQPEDKIKSVSNEHTFPRDVNDFETVRQVVFTLAEKVGGRLRRAGFAGRTVHLKIRFADFKTLSRNLTLPDAINLTEDIYRTAEILLEEFQPLPMPVRLVGVGVSALVQEENRQLTLWENDRQRRFRLERVMDQIQDKFGKHIIRHARSLEGKFGEQEEKPE